MWTYLKLLLTLLPGELNIDEAFKAYNEAEAKGGGLPLIITTVIANADKVFPDAITRPIVVLALQGLLYLHHGNVAALATADAMKQTMQTKADEIQAEIDQTK